MANGAAQNLPTEHQQPDFLPILYQKVRNIVDHTRRVDRVKRMYKEKLTPDTRARFEDEAVAGNYEGQHYADPMVDGVSGGGIESTGAALKGAMPSKPVATACPGAATMSGAATTVGGAVAGAVDAVADPAITTPGAVGTAGASAAGGGGNAGGEVEDQHRAHVFCERGHQAVVGNSGEAILGGKRKGRDGSLRLCGRQKFRLQKPSESTQIVKRAVR